MSHFVHYAKYIRVHLRTCKYIMCARIHAYIRIYRPTCLQPKLHHVPTGKCSPKPAPNVTAEQTFSRSCTTSPQENVHPNVQQLLPQESFIRLMLLGRPFWRECKVCYWFYEGISEFWCPRRARSRWIARNPSVFLHTLFANMTPRNEPKSL